MADLRVTTGGPGETITIFVNGRPCAAIAGETVHGALFAAGYRVLGKTVSTGQPRGIFCGMGVCYECRVTIDGVPNQRACMTTVEDRMEIRIDE